MQLKVPKGRFAAIKHDHLRIARDPGAIRQALMICTGFASERRVFGIDFQSSSRAGDGAAGYIPY
jgi:hypothetical protein